MDQTSSTHQEHTGPQVVRLPDAGEVHIWRVNLEPPGDSLPERMALLSPDELARARRYVFERDRLRYTAGRAFLRRQLGAYLGVDPARVAFAYSSKGKPFLKEEAHSAGLVFNFSNSNNRALAAFCRAGSLGVDLERIHPMPDEEDFARQFYCDTELALLRSLTGKARVRAFFDLWTCKEALLKAMGDGLTRPINEVEVSLAGSRPRLVSIAGDPAQALSWQLFLFQPAPGFQAALAYSGAAREKALRLLFFDSP